MEFPSKQTNRGNQVVVEVEIFVLDWWKLKLEFSMLIFFFLNEEERESRTQERRGKVRFVRCCSEGTTDMESGGS